MPPSLARRSETLAATAGPSSCPRLFLLVLTSVASFFLVACGGGSSTPDTLSTDAGTAAPLAMGGTLSDVNASSDIATNTGAVGQDAGSGVSASNSAGTSSAPSDRTEPATSSSAGSADGSTTSSQAIGAVRTGDGTYHPGTDGSGACEYDATPDNLMVAAINGPEYQASAACGSFIRATGPKGTVTVRIVDYCPECKAGDIDFSVEAFAKIATAPPGRVRISWQIVPGDVQGPIHLRYRESSSRSWVAIQVRNHRLPITKLEVLPSGESAWRNAPRQSWNYFVVEGKVASGPIRVRVTAIDGQTLEEILPEPRGGLEVAGRGQF